MSEQALTRCAAATKAGKPCKNYAVEGTTYCRVHQNVAQAEPSAAISAIKAELLARKTSCWTELDELVADLKTAQSPPNTSPTNPLQLLTYLRQKPEPVHPEMRNGHPGKFPVA